uniref:Uncharacterized protein n=1 Tax=Romanomermis culicivorax TaxID=13658 RepID=A0A915JEX2_ROMCU
MKLAWLGTPSRSSTSSPSTLWMRYRLLLFMNYSGGLLSASIETSGDLAGCTSRGSLTTSLTTWESGCPKASPINFLDILLACGPDQDPQRTAEKL